MPNDPQDLAARALPRDADAAILVGRVWSQAQGGPAPVTVRGDQLIDLSGLAPTVSELLELDGVAQRIRRHAGARLGTLAEALSPAWTGAPAPLRLLAPVDLQCLKACGVTFAVSALERVIEEKAKGDPAAAAGLRGRLEASLGGELSAVRPGSPGALRLKASLIEAGLWSQYLEVAIGPDAEVFTKAPVLSAVGWGDLVGVRSDSAWNNPEPEIVLVCTSRGEVAGATLGNDVNLRDIEGRSALLLGKAKDNNASCALGPFIRLFDAQFGMDDVRQADVDLEIVGDDRFRLEERTSMRLIGRDPLELVGQTCGRDHDYPDGFALFLGTLFAPVKDRGAPGQGFTHHVGDLVRIRTPKLGELANRVALAHEAPRWTMGIGALIRNLAARGLLSDAAAA